MKKLLFTVIFLLFTGLGYAANADSLSVSTANFDKDSCTCKDKKLYGRVRVVKNFADFRVRITNSFPDLRVQIVSSFADRCGEWIFVDNFEDFTVEFVDNFEDFSIEYVSSFPGVR